MHDKSMNPMFIKPTCLLLTTLVLMNPTHGLSVQENKVESSSDAPATKIEQIESHERPGLVARQPQNGTFVRTEFGYMVPYKANIPGSDVEFEMVPIAGGKFRMGSPDAESDRRTDEGPQFEVIVEPFWMGKYEVTWAEYKLYMNLDRIFKAFQSKGIRGVDDFSNVDAITAPSSLYDPSFTYEAGDEPRQPAATMSQYAARQYTKWLSLLSKDFYRLPTEAEWEYACRAGTTTAWYFGDDPKLLDEHAWFIETSDELRHDVGQLKPNPWGLYDMYGNVAEWVLDGYNENGYDKNLPDKPVTTAQAFAKPAKVFPGVLRGGSWELEAEDCRSAARLPSDNEWRDEDPNYPQSPWWFTTSPGLGTGFRIIRPLTPPPTRKEQEAFWEPGIERIMKDAKNRILDNGRGAFGLVDPELPEAIRQLKDEDR